MAWALPLLALAVGYASAGLQGVVLAITVIVFWLLLQWSRALRVLQRAGRRPVGLIPSAVMLHAKLHPGMSLADVLALTGSLGRKLEGRTWDGADEHLQWSDASGARVEVHLHQGRVQSWQLQRAASPVAASAEVKRHVESSSS